MIGKSSVIQSKDFKVGLFTRSDIIQANPDFSPNCMDVKWYFDDAIGKRFGSSTTNAVQLSTGVSKGNGTFIVQQSLTSNLVAYWKMDEASGSRLDSYGNINLNEQSTVPSIVGIRNNAADFFLSGGSTLYANPNSSLTMQTNQDWTIAGWIYVNGTGASNYAITYQTGIFSTTFDFAITQELSGTLQKLFFRVNTNGSPTYVLSANSYGALSLNNWYSFVAWHSNATHIGLSVNMSADTMLVGSGITLNTGGQLVFGAIDTLGTIGDFQGRVDEVGFWSRVLTSTERSQLYAGGSGNTYTPQGIAGLDTWYSFDFGASTTRWLTVCAGTGILASSNLGTTFVTIATTRTATYQYLDRSKNVLIATSDDYDVPLYWAGSAGTFASALAINSAPKAKFSINYQGFCILMNYMNSNNVVSNRGFAYEDENTQLSGLWDDSFDLPSEAADEITAPFVLNRFLYVSTKYRIFRLNYTGGNPDWEYIQVANWGFVPRTVRVFNVKEQQYAVGLDWSRRMRAFAGYRGEIISDNVENANDSCEFAMDNISLAGSGLLISNAEFDQNEQEYRLNVAIGAQSTQTTHAIVFNARTLALYPYSNQPYNTICAAESGGRQFLMGFDRSGLCHILNSGNLDAGVIPVNDIYDSPLLFKSSPSEVTKNKQINFFFSHLSSGTLYYQERFDFSNIYNEMKPLRNAFGDSQLTGNESSIIITRTVDLPSVQNIYQYRLTSSANTAIPWKLTHFDLFNSALGVGRGK